MSGVRESGVVVDVAETKVRIQVTPVSEDCCATCGGCASAKSGGPRLFETTPVAGLAVGDRVVIETAPLSRVSSSLLLFLVPLLGLLIGAIVGQAAGPSFGLSSEGCAIVAGLALLVLSYLVVALIDRRVRRRGGRSGPRIVSILGDEGVRPLDDVGRLG